MSSKLSLEELAELAKISNQREALTVSQPAQVLQTGQVVLPPTHVPLPPTHNPPISIPTPPVGAISTSPVQVESRDYPDTDLIQQELPLSSGISGILEQALQNKQAKESRHGKNKTTEPKGHQSDPTGERPDGGVASPQRKRSTRKVDDNRLFDGTHLSALHHGYFVHRDYASHFFRWGWVARFVKIGYRVLDIGCGQECPLARVISAPNVYPNCRPEKVVAVDYNPIPENFNPAWLHKIGEFNFCQDWIKLIGSVSSEGKVTVFPESKFDLISCLEVIEHMQPDLGDQLLIGARECLKPGGIMILSTPVFNGSAAANHIHEYEIPELHEKILAAGLTPIERFGTFANLNDIKKVCTAQEWELVQTLRRFYANDVLSCFLAPKYPDASRNNTWILCRTEDWNAGTFANWKAPEQLNLTVEEIYDSE